MRGGCSGRVMGLFRGVQGLFRVCLGGVQGVFSDRNGSG